MFLYYSFTLLIINSLQGNLWKENSIPGSRDAIKKELEDLISEGSSLAVEKVEWENIFKELNVFGYQEWYTNYVLL